MNLTMTVTRPTPARYKSVRIEMGDHHRSRFELFVQAPVWLLALVVVLATLINVAWILLKVI